MNLKKYYNALDYHIKIDSRHYISYPTIPILLKYNILKLLKVFPITLFFGNIVMSFGNTYLAENTPLYIICYIIGLLDIVIGSSCFHIISPVLEQELSYKSISNVTTSFKFFIFIIVNVIVSTFIKFPLSILVFGLPLLIIYFKYLSAFKKMTNS